MRDSKILKSIKMSLIWIKVKLILRDNHTKNIMIQKRNKLTFCVKVLENQFNQIETDPR